MKIFPVVQSELDYVLKQIHVLQQSIISEHEFGLYNEQVIKKAFLATQVKHTSGVRLARTLPEKAAILLYELLKNRSASKNNRKMSFIVFSLFLYKNNNWLFLSAYEIKALMVWIENSHRLAQKQTIEGVRNVIAAHIESL